MARKTIGTLMSEKKKINLVNSMIILKFTDS